MTPEQDKFCDNNCVWTDHHPDCKLSQPEQAPVAWKLVPIKPTRKMLEAMDECSIEGYDEHLYAGHAASVYMAAVDVAPTPPQRKEPEQEPVAFPRNVQEYDEDWIIDPAFLTRVKHSIDPETPYEFTPSEEQIETTLLALEVIPSALYTTPPQRKPLTDEELKLEFGKLYPNDIGILELAENNKDFAVEAIGARHHWVAFKAGAKAIEAAHGIKE